MKAFPGNKSHVNRTCLSRDGTTLVIFTATELLAYSTESAKLISRAEQPAGAIRGCFLPPDGETAFCFGRSPATGLEQEPITFYSVQVQTGIVKTLRTAPSTIGWISSSVISGDGKYMFIPNGRLPAIHVIDTATGREKATYCSSIIPKLMVVSPDEKHVFIGDEGKNIVSVPVELLLKAKPLNEQEIRDSIRKANGGGG